MAELTQTPADEAGGKSRGVRLRTLSPLRNASGGLAASPASLAGRRAVDRVVAGHVQLSAGGPPGELGLQTRRSVFSGTGSAPPT